MSLLASSATLFQLSGCDPTLRTTVESGIINISTAVLTSFVQALLQAGQSTTP